MFIFAVFWKSHRCFQQDCLATVFLFLKPLFMRGRENHILKKLHRYEPKKVFFSNRTNFGTWWRNKAKTRSLWQGKEISIFREDYLPHKLRFIKVRSEGSGIDWICLLTKKEDKKYNRRQELNLFWVNIIIKYMERNVQWLKSCLGNTQDNVAYQNKLSLDHQFKLHMKVFFQQN